MLESTTKFTGERYQVGMLLSEPEPNLPQNYSPALRKLHLLGRISQRDPKLKCLDKQSMETEVEKRFVKIVDDSTLKDIFGK